MITGREKARKERRKEGEKERKNGEKEDGSYNVNRESSN